MHHYQLCGLSIRSEWELAGAIAVPATTGSQAVIKRGDVPKSLPNAVGRGGAFESAPGRLLLKVPNVGRFLVRDGCEILVAPEPTAQASEIRAFLMGSAFAALLHQNGILPLHASTVEVDGEAVAFVGQSGAGKSTLASFLGQRGYPLLGDDVCPIRVMPGLGPVAFQGFMRFKLWENSVQALGKDSAEYSRVRPTLQKYEVPAEHRCTQPYLPLRRIYVLHETRDGQTEGIEEVKGVARLAGLVHYTFRSRYLAGFGLQADHFRMCSEVLGPVQVFELSRPWKLKRTPEIIDWLEDQWGVSTMSAASSAA
tara:strand:+ start:34297 stop:35229 length:933 start_codon:yes stop_codon:yes gene_type:complete